MGTEGSESQFENLVAVAVMNGWVSDEQLKEVEDTCAKLKAQGLEFSGLEVLLKKGFITPQQSEELKKKQRAAQFAASIKGFEIKERLGQGAMGTVFKARQRGFGRMVALKILSPNLAKKPDFVKRFMREARASATVSHPNIIQGIDVGESSGYHYFAMEYVEGKTLRKLFHEHGKFSERDVMKLGLQMSGALEAAARAGLVHRDIKPENILITSSDGQAKLCDLGLARMVDEDSSLTQTNAALGTPLYMAPEQVQDSKGADGRSDLYSLGATMYHLLCGRPLFSGDTGASIMTSHLLKEAPSPQSFAPDVSLEMCKVLRKLLAKDPGNRYQTPTELREDLEALRDGKPLQHASSMRGKSSISPLGVPRAGRRASKAVPVVARDKAVRTGQTSRHASVEARAGAAEETPPAEVGTFSIVRVIKLVAVGAGLAGIWALGYLMLLPKNRDAPPPYRSTGEPIFRVSPRPGSLHAKAPLSQAEEREAKAAFDATIRFEGLAEDDRVGRAKRLEAFIEKYPASVQVVRARHALRQLLGVNPSDTRRGIASSSSSSGGLSRSAREEPVLSEQRKRLELEKACRDAYYSLAAKLKGRPPGFEKVLREDGTRFLKQFPESKYAVKVRSMMKMLLEKDEVKTVTDAKGVATPTPPQGNSKPLSASSSEDKENRAVKSVLAIEDPGGEPRDPPPEDFAKHVKEFKAAFYAFVRKREVEKAKANLTLVLDDSKLNAYREELVAFQKVLEWLEELKVAEGKGLQRVKTFDRFVLKLKTGMKMDVGRLSPSKILTVKGREVTVGNRGMSVVLKMDRMDRDTRNRLASAGLASDAKGLVLKTFVKLLSGETRPDARYVAWAMDRAVKAKANEGDLKLLKSLAETAGLAVKKPAQAPGTVAQAGPSKPEAETRGPFGRSNDVKTRLARAQKEGGNLQTEAAVKAALAWLAAHQSMKGCWDAMRFGGKKADVSVTGLALMAFLAAGHTESSGRYKVNVVSAVEWLKSIQQPDGKLYVEGETNGVGYHHGIAGLALVEAAGMGGKPETLRAAKAAVEYSITRHQGKKNQGLWGWRYQAGDQKCDLSVSGWFIMQLKSARMIGLTVNPASFEGAAHFLDSVEVNVEGQPRHRYGYTSPINLGVRRTAMGCVARIFLGWKPDQVRSGIEWFIKTGGVPQWGANGGDVDLYYWYYGSQAAFQLGGPLWRTWNESLKQALLPHQNMEGQKRGSWELVGAYAPYWGTVGQTALSCLCLETYYRYPRTGGKGPLQGDQWVAREPEDVAKGSGKGAGADSAQSKIPGVAPIQNIPTGSKAGLKVSYYRGQDVKGRPLAAGPILPNVQFNYLRDAPKEAFCAVLEGYLKVPKPGNYTFTLVSEERCKVYIGQKLRIDGQSESRIGLTRNLFASFNLMAGYQRIRVEYFHEADATFCQLSWALKNVFEKQIIPKGYFIHRSEVDPNAPAKPAEGERETPSNVNPPAAGSGLAQKRFDGYMKLVLSSIKAQDFDKAVLLVKQMKADSALGRFQSTANVTAGLVEFLAAQEKSRLASLKMLVGTMVNIQTDTGIRNAEVQAVDGDEMRLRSKFVVNGQPKYGQEFKVKVSGLSEEAQAKLMPVPEPATAGAWAAKTLRAVAQGRLEDARTYLPKLKDHPLESYLRARVESLEAE